MALVKIARFLVPRRWRAKVADAFVTVARPFRRVRYERQYSRFKALSAGTTRDLPISYRDRLICLHDATRETGFDRHYTYHPAWAARCLSRIKPERHVDFSSALSFSAIASAFVPMEFYDFRPAALRLPWLKIGAANLLHLPFPDNSIPSLSCMHVIEHVGLGRYGDDLDPSGDLRAIEELSRVLAPGGHMLIAVPVGRARIAFNAHRIYRHSEFISYFKGMELVEFSLIPDDPAPDGMIDNAPSDLVDRQEYGCGCYWFRKLEEDEGRQ